MIRQYRTPEEARTVAKEIIWLAYQASAVGGMGFLQAQDNATREQVWDAAVNRRDYNGFNASETDIYCDYVMGRMMKVGLRIKNDAVEVLDWDRPHPAYQSWAYAYQTHEALVVAAEESLGLSAKAAR